MYVPHINCLEFLEYNIVLTISHPDYNEHKISKNTSLPWLLKLLYDPQLLISAFLSLCGAHRGLCVRGNVLLPLSLT